MKLIQIEQDRLEDLLDDTLFYLIEAWKRKEYHAVGIYANHADSLAEALSEATEEPHDLSHRIEAAMTEVEDFVNGESDRSEDDLLRSVTTLREEYRAELRSAKEVKS